MSFELRGKRIMIVEDNTLNRVVYTMVLQVTGAILHFDKYGKETMQELQRFIPDLMILDLMLGKDIDGFQIFEMIRQQSEYNDVPIVAISASDPSSALPKCQDMGFAGFIAKPIEQNLLVDQVSRLIEGKQVWYLGERYGGEIKQNDT